MGQIIVDNAYDAEFWKQRFQEITGRRPEATGNWNYQVSISDDLLPQETCDALLSIRNRRKERDNVVEVKNPTVSLGEREAAAAQLTIQRQAIEKGNS